MIDQPLDRTRLLDRGMSTGGWPGPCTDATSVVMLLYLAVATIALAYGLLYAALRSTSGSAVTIATLVERASADLLAVLLLGERLTWPATLGGGLILTAVVALRPDGEHPAPG